MEKSTTEERAAQDEVDEYVAELLSAAPAIDAEARGRLGELLMVATPGQADVRLAA